MARPPVLALSALKRLAARDDVESRLIIRTGREWALHHGPFPAGVFRDLPPDRWTLLVQGTNHHMPTMESLLRQFAFIPHARLDDVMVSYAAPGGGVGPHFDSYDVFLLQAAGRRRWRISGQRDLALRPRLPLRILARFRPEAEWVLAPGDMLYLPPQVAHDGVAVDACMTYSIGFRSPAARELAAEFFARLAETLVLDGRYADAGLRPARHPGRLPPALVRYAVRAVERVRWSDALVEDIVGRYVSTPKAHVVFDPPERPLARASFVRALRQVGIELDPRTILLYVSRGAFINGERWEPTDASVARVVRQLADDRALPAAPGLPRSAVAALYDWYTAGFLHPRQAPA